MIDFFLKSFLETGEPKKAEEVMSACLKNGHIAIAKDLGEFFLSIYPTRPELLFQTALSYLRCDEYEKAYEYSQKIVNLHGLPVDFKKKIDVVINTCIPNLKDLYVTYNKDIVDRIVSRPSADIPLITLTITTCKRYDLFEKTINSFLNTCLDVHKIDKWFCVDDNSSEEDRKKMQERYPFFEFYMKDLSEKGHPQSMNIIRDKVNTPFLFHMEDDWCFFAKRNYITECMDIASQDDKIGQCLINRNYGETDEHRATIGGFERTSHSGLKYYIHEYCPTEKDMQAFYQKYGHCQQCAYWPHFSFRPSLLKKKVLDDIGEFNTKVSHFERKYADEYYKKGYYSVFFPGIYCMHTGRLTAEIDDESKINAYALNKEKQFSGKETNEREGILNLRILTINLNKRVDRWEKFMSQKEVSKLPMYKFSAIDGNNIKPTEQLQRIFDGNDYNMRCGLVGCALSHLLLYTNLIKEEKISIYLILEDDAELTDNFAKKLDIVVSTLEDNFDVCFLGHHLWPEYKTKGAYDREKTPTLEKWTTTESMKYSIGGTAGYLITKRGAKRFLDFVNKNGMTNGIDTMLQKACDTLDVYYCYPHMVFSECHVTNRNCDTDIQNNFSSLTIPSEIRYKRDLEYFSQKGNVFTVTNFILAKDYCERYDKEYICMIYSGDRVKELMKICSFPCYPISYDHLVVVQDPTEQMRKDRYFERMLRDGKYDIGDAIDIIVSKRKFIPFSDMTHLEEAFEKVIQGYKPTYPFDTIDEGGLANLIHITTEVLKCSDLNVYVKDLFDPAKNEIKTLQHNRKTIFKSSKYGFSLPRDELDDVERIYLERYKNLKEALHSDEIAIVCCTRWPEVAIDTITEFYDLLTRYSKDVKILLINCIEDTEIIPDKYQNSIKKVTLEFPITFKDQPWNPEKIKYDQTVFRPGIVQPLSHFVELY